MRQTMESLRANTKMPYRLTVVDNGPPEQTDYLKSCDIDRHIINEKNAGPAESRNIGLQATDNEIIAFCDNDLQFEPKWLKCATARILRKWPKHKLIVAPVATHPRHRARKYHVGTFRGKETCKMASSLCLVMWRSTAEELCPWEYGLLNIEDKTFCIKAWNNGYVFIRHPPQWPHVIHAGEHHKTFDPARNVFTNGKWESKTIGK